MSFRLGTSYQPLGTRGSKLSSCANSSKASRARPTVHGSSVRGNGAGGLGVHIGLSSGVHQRQHMREKEEERGWKRDIDLFPLSFEQLRPACNIVPN